MSLLHVETTEKARNVLHSTLWNRSDHRSNMSTGVMRRLHVTDCERTLNLSDNIRQNLQFTSLRSMYARQCRYEIILSIIFLCMKFIAGALVFRTEAEKWLRSTIQYSKKGYAKQGFLRTPFDLNLTLFRRAVSLRICYLTRDMRKPRDRWERRPHRSLSKHHIPSFLFGESNLSSNSEVDRSTLRDFFDLIVMRRTRTFRSPTSHLTMVRTLSDTFFPLGGLLNRKSSRKIEVMTSRDLLHQTDMLRCRDDLLLMPYLLHLVVLSSSIESTKPREAQSVAEPPPDHRSRRSPSSQWR